MQTAPDLSTLRNSRDDGNHSPASAGGGDPSHSPVPPPASRWKTRILLPALVLGAAAAVLAYSARDAFQPAVAVNVVPAVVRQATEAPVGGVVAQAPGWVEPDPYAITVPALADGIVQDVLILEGQSVKAGQVLVQLVDADARLALAKAQAELAQRQAELTAAELAVGSPKAHGKPSVGPSDGEKTHGMPSVGFEASLRLERMQIRSPIDGTVR